MNRRLGLAALLLAAALRPLAATQFEGGAGLEGGRSTPLPAPTPSQIPGGQLELNLTQPVGGGAGAVDLSAVPSELSSRLSSTQRAPASETPATPVPVRDETSASADGERSAEPTQTATALPTTRAAATTEASKRASPRGELLNQAPTAERLLQPAASPRSIETERGDAAAMFGEGTKADGARIVPTVGRETTPRRGLFFWRGHKGTDAGARLAKPPKPPRTLTRKLIWWNVGVFALTFPLMPYSAALLGLINTHVLGMLLGGPPLGVVHALATMFTHMFVHQGLYHLASNMALLWLFGRSVEARWGRASMKRIYFASGLAGAAAAVLLIPVPMLVVGASVAIFGVIAAYLVSSLKGRALETDQRGKWLVAAFGVFGVLSHALGLLAVGDPISLLFDLTGAIANAAILASLFSRRGVAAPKILLAGWLVLENVLLLLIGGPFAGQTYVLGHLVGAIVGAGLASVLISRTPPAAPAAS